MNILEFTSAKCPKCMDIGAFITVHFSPSTDATRDWFMRIIVVHKKCGLELSSEQRFKTKELTASSFWDKNNYFVKMHSTPKK